MDIFTLFLCCEGCPVCTGDALQQFISYIKCKYNSKTSKYDFIANANAVNSMKFQLNKTSI